MLQCLSVNSPSPSTLPPRCYPDSLPPPLQDGAPESSAVSSPVDLQQVYSHNLQSESYKQMWTQIQDYGSDYEEMEVSVHGEEDCVEVTQEKVLSMVLQPNRECVVEALVNVKTSKLKRLVSAYFDESENISFHFFLLRKGVRQARGLYKPLLELLSVLPDDIESLTEPQCFRAYELFSQFDSHCRENPFLCLDIDRFKPMQDCFSKLKEHLNLRTSRSLSRANLIRRSTSGPGLLLIGTATVVAVAAAAAMATGHFVLASVAAPCVAGYMAPKKYAEKEEVRAKKLKDAAYVTFALDEHLKTINSLVDRLRTAIEDDKRLIQIGLDRNGDMYPIKQVIKHLRRNPSDFLQQLEHLEVDICLCFTTVNKARRLLQEICCAKYTASS